MPPKKAAKKAAKKAVRKPVVPLTEDEINFLVGKLAGTKLNVHRVCETLFGRSFGDEIFDRLETEGSLRKCVECGTWKECDAFADDDLCDECNGLQEGDEWPGDSSENDHDWNGLGGYDHGDDEE